MQEEIENRTVALAISTGKLTGRALQAAIRKLLADLKKNRDCKFGEDVRHIVRVCLSKKTA